MKITVHNTLSNRREVFAPADASRVTMYVCGPTVYGPAHLGNARPAVVFDILFRLLSHAYPQVLYARNITDIDDKIIKAAAASGEPAPQLADKWRRHYEGEMSALGILPPTFAPAATDNIAAMTAMIEALIKKGNAYVEQGHVFFATPTFADYGALSNRPTDAPSMARIDNLAFKKNAADFVLWKPSPPEEPGWKSPWGRGRPGWHIECSAMAAQCLGETIDIHGGGQDLIFPHHENEIAQSRCASGGEVFARYWMHNGHLALDGEKMSKSLGNDLSIGGALADYDGEAVRYALLSTHYRRPLNWSKAVLQEAKSALDSLYRARALLGDNDNNAGDNNHNKECPITAALCDDLNTPSAFAAMHSAAAAVNRGDANRQQKHTLTSGAGMMGFLHRDSGEWFRGENAKSGGENTKMDAAQIEEMITARNNARQNRDFAAADNIRNELAKRGIILEDTPSGTTWRIG
ncbi:MAG: cysteine--tRNA ligase [Gammaproteobacteria bacterium]